MKNKVTNLDIVVRVIDGKPYYSLKYKELGNNYFNVGYSSCSLENVIAWKNEYFDMIQRNEDDGWIPVSERMPEEHDSIFAKFKGTDNWKRGMCEKISKYVIATVVFDDGTVLVEQAYTTDGIWRTDKKVFGGTVVAWMDYPEPYKEN